MATKYAISTEFSIVDRATAQLNKMAAAGRGFGGIWQRGIADAQSRLDAFGMSVANAGKWAVGGAIGAASAGLVVATKQYAAFDEAVRAAGAAYGPAFSKAADFEDKIGSMGKAVRAVAAATEFDATQSANALKTLALAGVKSEQAVALLPGVADLATAAMTDMDSAVALAVGSLNTMGMMSDKPAQLAANMTRISDVMAHTANSAYMSLQDVASAISSGGSFFRTANNDLNIMSGSLTALAANSIKGAEAGTALRNIMTNLSAPTDKAAAALAQMRVQMQDAAGNMLPLPKIIGQFSKAMAGMGDAERNANLYAIFGKQNIAAVTALLNTGQSALEEYALAAMNSAGTVTANAEAMRGSLVNKFKVMMSALTELGFQFVDAFAVKGGEALDAITKAISEFNPQPLVDALVFAGNVISGVVKTAWALRGVIGVMAGAFVAWRVATTGAAIALGIKNGIVAIATGVQIAYGMVIGKSAAATSAFAFATGKAKVAAVLFSGALKIVTAVQAGFNAVLAANPIGLIVAGIILVVAVIVTLISRIERVRNAVDGFFQSIREMKGIGGFILKNVATPFETVWTLLKGIGEAINVFKSHGLLAGINMIGVAMLEAIAVPLDRLLSLLAKIPVIGDTFSGWSDKLHTFIDDWRASILEKKEEDTPDEKAEDFFAPPPSASDAAASSYSESVTTNRLEVALDERLSGRMVGRPAPVFSIYAGR